LIEIDLQINIEIEIELFEEISADHSTLNTTKLNKKDRDI
jgi:hypothetical protein